MKEQQTYYAKPKDIKRDWLLIDAKDIVLGRVATQIASYLRGKHKTMFTPSVDVGDFVVVINADKVRLTGNKEDSKKYYRHSRFPGGLKTTQYKDMLEKHPERIVYEAVRGMLPHNRLGRAMIKKLKVYASETHPHDAQNLIEKKVVG